MEMGHAGVSQHGNVVAAGAFKDHLNFFKGASLQDPHRLFNAGLEAKASRAIDIYEGDTVRLRCRNLSAQQ
jgi:hypothetical protein